VSRLKSTAPSARCAHNTIERAAYPQPWLATACLRSAPGRALAGSCLGTYVCACSGEACNCAAVLRLALVVRELIQRLVGCHPPATRLQVDNGQVASKLRDAVMGKVRDQLPAATKASKVKLTVDIPELQLERQSAFFRVAPDGSVDVNTTLDLQLSALQAAVQVRVCMRRCCHPLMTAAAAAMRGRCCCHKWGYLSAAPAQAVATSGLRMLHRRAARRRLDSR
jgi:hypothetical protein